MRNIAISLLRLTGWKNIKQATEKMSRRVGQILTLLWRPAPADRKEMVHGATTLTKTLAMVVCE